MWSFYSYSCNEFYKQSKEAQIKFDLVKTSREKKIVRLSTYSMLNDVRSLRSDKASVEADVNACSNKTLVLGGVQKQI